MSLPHDGSQDYAHIILDGPLRMLTSNLIEKLDDALCQVGDFGEVRLIVVKGKLRFIQTMASESIDDTSKVRNRQ